MQVVVVSLEREVWSGEASRVVSRTLEGDLGIEDNHIPLLGALAPHVLLIRAKEGEDVRMAVHGGFLSVSQNEVAVLADVAELPDDIDVGRAEEAARRAQGEVDAAADEDEGRRARGALARAETRLAAAR